MYKLYLKWIFKANLKFVSTSFCVNFHFMNEPIYIFNQFCIEEHFVVSYFPICTMSWCIFCSLKVKASPTRHYGDDTQNI